MTNTKYNLIGERYADALVQMAQEGKMPYEKILQDITTIEEILRNSKDLDAFLKNPLTSINDKKDVINKVFSQEIDGLMLNFLKVLADENRIEAFDEIFSHFKSRLDKINNISRVNVISAIMVSENAKNRLKSKLEEKIHKTVTIDWAIDKSIIAGLVIKMGDNIIDTSLKHKLEDLSKAIAK